MVLPLNRLMQAAVFSVATLSVPAASAADESISALLEHDTGVMRLSELGSSLRELMRPEIGFPENYIGAWQQAVDEAFAVDLLEADYVEALEQHTTDDARQAAVAFIETDLAAAIRALDAAEEPDADLSFEQEIEAARKIVDGASAEQNALFVELFELQRGPETANAIMDAYYHMMKTAADPIVGAEAADEWVTGFGSTLRDAYVEGYFLTTAAQLIDLDLATLEELTQKMAEPALVAYADQSTLAFSDALQKAADRLAVAYPKAIAGR